eukprot:gene6735-13634_t
MTERNFNNLKANSNKIGPTTRTDTPQGTVPQDLSYRSGDYKSNEMTYSNRRNSNLFRKLSFNTVSISAETPTPPTEVRRRAEPSAEDHMSVVDEY